MHSTPSERQARTSQKPRHNKKRGKRYNRRPVNQEFDVNEAIFRISRTADGKVFLSWLEHLITTLKVTVDTDDGQIKPDSVACHWQACGQWILNNIAKRADEGYESTTERDEFDRDDYEREQYENPRGDRI